MELSTTRDRLKQDHLASTLFELLESNEIDLKLEGARFYHDFPLYRDDDQTVVSKVILVSPRHGVFVIGTSGASDGDSASLTEADIELDATFGHVHSRLTKQRSLRKDRKNLSFDLDAFIFAPHLEDPDTLDGIESPVVRNSEELIEYFEGRQTKEILPEVIGEICSVIEGAKGLVPPKKRDITGKNPNSKVSLVTALEAEIRSFDQDQKQGYLSLLEGPQRIRGLAGSGKTVVLAMKAAITHLKDPDAKILFTFYTRSLYQHVRRLITRFYRQYDDRDPNWDNIKVLHAWGGYTRAGVYFQACVDHGIKPLRYNDVSNQAHPFDTACKDLLSRSQIKPTYDYVFVDEGQDFPTSFLQLCLELAQHRRFVYAYDELQTIFQADTPSAEAIFGAGAAFDEDVVLHKCYRNPLEVLVCAHSLGFGIYSDRMIQTLENADHWTDLGYEVVSAEFFEGGRVDIFRPDRNSPSSISKRSTIDAIVGCQSYLELKDEIVATVGSIAKDIEQEGLDPEDILVISADDRNAKVYLGAIAAALAERGIQSHNLNADTFGGDVFSREGCVTLTSIHRAKGNEAYSVYVVGIDALFLRPTIRQRNMIFTAMTRAKAWVQVSGMGEGAVRFKKELETAKKYCPHLLFTYPSEEALKVMKRDLDETTSMRAENLIDQLMDDYSLEEVRKLLDSRARVRDKSKGKRPGRTKKLDK